MMRADVLPLLDRAALLRDWAELEPTARSSCFTSVAWVRTWLEALPPDIPLYVARAMRGDVLVALAVFGRGLVRTKLGARDTLHLHTTGDSRFDRLCVEMNGLLVRAADELQATETIVETITTEMPEIDCVVWPALRDGRLVEAAARRCGWLVDCHATDAPYVDLAELRRGSHIYREVLKKKARYAVRQATRRYTDTFGVARVVEATNEEEASAALAQLAHWSRTRWASTRTESAFGEPFFEQFHQQLVATQFGTGLPRLLRVHFGDVCAGIVYVLEHRGWCAFYQCGYDYALLGDRAQPGYAVLPLVIEHLGAAGHNAFDFLGEGTHYKRMLATLTRDFVSLTLMRPTLRNQAERYARHGVAQLRRFAPRRRTAD
jgi:CelD/BcsL family acetyltransferase involved in cellulose biosynthesis